MLKEIILYLKNKKYLVSKKKSSNFAFSKKLEKK